MYLLEIELCENYNILNAVAIIKNIFNIVCIIIPILIIIFIMIDFFKAIISNDEEAIKKAAIAGGRRIIAGIIVFFIPTLANAFINFLNININANIDLASCIENSNNLEYYKELKEAEKEENRINSNSIVQKVINSTRVIKSIINESSSSEGTTIGKTYKLSDSDLNFITKVCQCEQPTAEGAAGEASLIVNRYELYGSSYSSIRSYVENSGWFACARYTSSQVINNDSRSKVKEVIELGNRSFELYVDEHDCYNCNNRNYCSSGIKGDICILKTNGNSYTSLDYIKNHSNYVSGSTVITNVYGSVYTFSKFPCSSCDPFGYTSTGKQRYESMNNR